MKPAFKGLVTLGLATPLLVILMGSDHKDGPSATADHAADIADLYAWHSTSAGTFTAVVTFGGFGAPGAPAIYDANALYTIHVDRSATTTFDNTPKVDINIRFGKDASGHFGVQVENLPGATAAIKGAVETTLNDGPKRKVFAGLRDDPFFFDLDGFKSTVATGALHFDSTHDTFAGTNVTAVVVEMDLADITVGGTLPHLQLWATTARKPTAIARTGIAPDPTPTHRPLTLIGSVIATGNTP